MRILPVTSFATVFAASCAIGVFAISVPVAQADERDDVLAAVQACLILTDNTERLACMDAATAQLDTKPEAELPAGKEVATPEVATPAPAPVIAPTAPTGPTTAEIEARERQLATERAALEAERQELAQQRAALEDAEIEKERRSPFSLPDAPPEIPVTIRKITVTRLGVHSFYTTDGDIFVQADTRRRFRPPSALPATGVVRQGLVGSKWLAFDEMPDKVTKITLRRD